MDIVNEKRALMSYTPKRDNVLMFTYKDVERDMVNPGLLGIKIGRRVMYAELLSNQENRYLMGVLIKSLRSHYEDESDKTHDALVKDLVGLGFNLVGISNIRQRPGTMLWDFETTYPNYLQGQRTFKRETFLGTVAAFLKRSRYKVNLAEVEHVSTLKFEKQKLIPETFHCDQSIICVYHEGKKRVMFNFDRQLWLTNISYHLNDTEKLVAFFEEIVTLANLLKNRHTNENIYHRIFASLTTLKLNGIEFRPAAVIRAADDGYVLSHRPYLFTDRSLSKEHHYTLQEAINKLSTLSKEVDHDRT